MDDDSEKFEAERTERIARNANSPEFLAASAKFTLASLKARYSYNFDWLGRPVIQYPQDIVAMQEVIWEVKPDLVIETGIARGGSLVMSASLLALLDYCDAARAGDMLDPRAPRRRVLGIDIDIRPHNRAAITSHPLARRIEMIQGSSIAPEIVAGVRKIAADYERILVCLDSNHTCDHVLAELEAYAPLVSKDSYCVVFDTVIADVPDEVYGDRPWTSGNNPSTAVEKYLSVLNKRQTIAADGDILLLARDLRIDGKLLVSVAPGGYLRRVANDINT
jgi:cephalosporin hydroxylase